jgi:glucoamylase
LEKWTVSQNGPYGPFPYYVRVTKDGDANAGTTYGLRNGGPSSIDQRAVADTGFLELARLGVKSPYYQDIINSPRVVDAQLAVKTSNGVFWYRYTDDGYGEMSTGAPLAVSFSDSFTTHGRLWPILAGERGEYDLATHNVFAAIIAARYLHRQN